MGHPTGPSRTRKTKVGKRKCTSSQGMSTEKFLALTMLLMSTNYLLPTLLMPCGLFTHRQQHTSKRPSQLKGTRFLLHYLNHFIELMLKLSNVNLVTRMQPWPAPNPPPHSHNPNVHRTHHIELHVHHTDKCWQLKHKVQVWLTRAPSPLTSR